MTENVQPNGKLTLRQSRAIAAVLFHSTLEDAARSIDISSKTLSRWLAEPAFQGALARVEAETITMATRRLIVLSEKAITTLEAVLGDAEATQAVRVRASAIVLDYLLRLRELVSLEKRVSELEGKTYEYQE